MSDYLCITPDVQLGNNVKLSRFINLYGCEIGDNTKIGAFVEVQKNAKIGKNCKISSHTFICEGVTIEDQVFIGHGVTFINDSYPRAATDGRLQTEVDWRVEKTLVKKRCFDWLGQHDSKQCNGGRKRDRRGGKRGYEGCSGKHDCRGQSRKDASDDRYKHWRSNERFRWYSFS